MALARWQATIVDEAGDVQPAASIEVREEVGGAPLAAIFSDRDGAVPLGNPFPADGDGFAAFHAAGGAYRITATLGEFSRVWRFVALGTAGELDADIVVTSLDAEPDEDEIAVFLSAGRIEGGGLTISALIAAVSSEGRHSIWMLAGSMQASETSGAEAGVYAASNGMNYPVLDFDSAADEFACFSIAFPKSYDGGTLSYQAFWTTTATDTDGVAWALQCTNAVDGAALNGTFGTAVVVTDDAQGAANQLLVTSESAPVTAQTGFVDGRMTNFRIFRDVSDANDDMTEDARLIGIRLFYNTNAPTDD